MIPEPSTLSSLFNESRTIAVVGLSAHPERPSYGVASYMQAQGYRIIPVNPTYAGTHILGEHCYPTLTLAAAALHENGLTIDIVDCFRRSEHIAPVADEAIAIRTRCIWMQLGVVDEAAAERAEKAGVMVVMDRCLKIEHMKLKHHQ